MLFNKPTLNQYGVTVRVSKCGRGQIAKLPRGGACSFVPSFDGNVLPPYWLLREAKEAIECAERGDPLPKATRSSNVLEYENVGVEAGAAAWEQTKAWVRANVMQGAAQTKPDASAIFEFLGLDPEETSAAELRRAYRAHQLRYHPDRNPEDEEAAAKFRRGEELWVAYLDDVSDEAV